jgi:hypothetical protein
MRNSKRIEELEKILTETLELTNSMVGAFVFCMSTLNNLVKAHEITMKRLKLLEEQIDLAPSNLDTDEETV